MSRVLVTGGAGFIGSHLCERLISLGHHVVSIDNYFTGSTNNHVDGVKYYTIPTEKINEQLSKYIPFDYVYHLGEYSRVEQSFDDIDYVWKNNMIGTQQVLEFVRRTGAKLIYAGSSTKFGDNNTGANQSPYAFSKSTNTKLVQNYGDWFDINYAITYFYNVYGQREISTGEYATLIGKYKTLYKERNKSEPFKLPVVYPGTQKRNFTHVDDIVDGLILVGKHGYGDGYGIGSPEAYSVNEIAEMFGAEIDYLPARKGNRMTADVHTENTIGLGWSAKRNIADYIKEFRESVDA